MLKIKLNMKKIVFAVIGVFALVSCNQEKTAYVDNTVLIQDFSQMKETEKRFNKKSEKLKRTLDSTAMAFRQEVESYQNKMQSLSAQARQEQEAALMQKQQQLQQSQQMQSQALRQESDEVIDSLITKVKDFVATYGEKNNYTYIFGSNESANIMYAKEGKDITQEVLKALNESVK